MPATVQWHFDTFRLDPAQACLWCEDAAVRLPPKVVAVLQYLVMHPDRLVTKEELLDAVWPATAVTDAVIRVAVGTLRKVLGDRAQQPRYIATVPRCGYRFLVPVTMVPSAASLSPVGGPGVSAPLLVEREAVLQHLQQSLGAAQQGRRQVVVLTGEPGIGKTAVVETFLAQGVGSVAWVAVGQCVESYGTDEAYLPILEALGQLCRGPDRARLVALLEQYAPTWLVQLPWLLRAAHRAQLHAELQGATRERMLREGADLLDSMTTERPLVLVLEDLHWSDAATLDLLVLVAQRRTSARLLLLGTVRPGEMPMSPPPRQRLLTDLQRHRAVTLMPVLPLSAAAVAAYLARRFPQQRLPGTLAAWLHQRTDGHPFFLVTLVQALLDQGVLYEHQGWWRMQADWVALAAAIPARLSQVLDQHIIRLPSVRQQVMEVASVAGVEFTAAMVAAGMEAAVEVIETHCDVLVAQQQLHGLGVTTWPHGTVTACYRFRHALVQQALYTRLSVGQRVRLHRRLGAWLEAASGAQAGDSAALLADHFARGGDPPRAIAYLHLAAEKAAQRYAHREVIALLRRALPLLAQLPETPARAQQELALQMTLGPALIATHGQAAAAVAQTYARAHMLCRQVPESPQLAQILLGLSHFHLVQGAHQTAQATGRHLLQVADRLDDLAGRLSAHGTLGVAACKGNGFGLQT